MGRGGLTSPFLLPRFPPKPPAPAARGMALLQGQDRGSRGRVVSQLTQGSALSSLCWVLLGAALTLLRGLQVYTLCFHILSLPRNVFCDFNIRQPLLFRVWCKLFQIWIPVCCIYTYIWTYNFLTKMASWRTSGLATIFFMLGIPPWMSFCVSVFHYLLLTILQAVSFLTTRNSVGKSVPIFLSYLCVSFSTEWILRREISEECETFNRHCNFSFQKISKFLYSH